MPDVLTSKKSAPEAITAQEAHDLWRTIYVPALVELGEMWAWSGRRRLSPAAIRRHFPEAEAVSLLRASGPAKGAHEQLEAWLDVHKDAWLWQTRRPVPCAKCALRRADRRDRHA